MRMFCSWDFVVKYVTFKHEKVGKHNFKQKNLKSPLHTEPLHKPVVESLLKSLSWEILHSNKDVW